MLSTLVHAGLIPVLGVVLGVVLGKVADQRRNINQINGIWRRE